MVRWELRELILTALWREHGLEGDYQIDQLGSWNLSCGR